MKKLLAVFMLFVLVALTVAAQEMNASIFLIDIEGVPLQLSELADTLGGLPRCCHDLDYDPIEDKCLNNKGQKYIDGVNDCDTWVEKVLSQAGIDISSRWGNAKITTVSGHVSILAEQLKGKMPDGWNIEIIDTNHVALTRVNKDGSADVYHQGKNRNEDDT